MTHYIPVTHVPLSPNSYNHPEATALYQAQLAAMGFELLPERDDKQVAVKVPAGWRWRYDEHGYWSYLVDAQDHVRGYRFLKSAFWDYEAFMTLYPRYRIGLLHSVPEGDPNRYCSPREMVVWDAERPDTPLYVTGTGKTPRNVRPTLATSVTQTVWVGRNRDGQKVVRTEKPLPPRTEEWDYEFFVCDNGYPNRAVRQREEVIAFKRTTQQVSSDADEAEYREARTRYYKAEEAVDAYLAEQTAKCKEWLDAMFPDHANPTAYWSPA